MDQYNIQLEDSVKLQLFGHLGRIGHGDISLVSTPRLTVVW